MDYKTVDSALCKWLPIGRIFNEFVSSFMSITTALKLVREVLLSPTGTESKYQCHCNFDCC